MKTKKHLGHVPAVFLALAAYLILANGPDADSATQQKRALRPAAGLATIYNVKAFGARGDGKRVVDEYNPVKFKTGKNHHHQQERDQGKFDKGSTALWGLPPGHCRTLITARR